MRERYIEATQEAGIALFSRKITGEVVMLNLLRFRQVADYTKFPDIMPSEPISGREAYQKYIDHTLPFLKKTGGSIAFIGEGGKYLIGPQDEQWDMQRVMAMEAEASHQVISLQAHEERCGIQPCLLRQSSFDLITRYY